MIIIFNNALFQAACRLCFDLGGLEFLLSFAHFHYRERLADGFSLIDLSSLELYTTSPD